MNLGARGLYDVRLRIAPLDELWRIVAATSTSAILVVAARVLANNVGGASTQAVRLWLWATILLGTGRLVTSAIIRRRQRAGHDQLPTLIIGAAGSAARSRRRCATTRSSACGRSAPRQLVPGRRRGRSLPVLGASWDFDRIVAEHGVGHVIFGFSTAPHEVYLRLLGRCERLGAEVSIVPRLFERPPRVTSIVQVRGPAPSPSSRSTRAASSSRSSTRSTG